jgi:glycine hydroxymethyltransferase
MTRRSRRRSTPPSSRPPGWPADARHRSQGGGVWGSAAAEFQGLCPSGIANARALAGRLQERGADLVAGGTDTHLALVDLRPLGLTGKDADEALERAGITCNKNGIPFDPLPPMKTSGIRVGSPAGTTRGFGIAEFRDIADMIATCWKACAATGMRAMRRSRQR